MCIKCELLDIISNLMKEQNLASSKPMKILSEGIMSSDIELRENNLKIESRIIKSSSG